MLTVSSVIESLEGRLQLSVSTGADAMPLGLSHSTFNLSQARDIIGAAAVGTKAFFSGGVVTENELSAAVDIFDQATRQWSTHSIRRENDARNAIAAGTKAIFSGLGGIASEVDIYDSVTGEWTSAHLSAKRQGTATFGVGTKAFFAGGTTNEGPGLTARDSAIVDLYDAKNGKWSVARLSQARSSIQIALVGGKVLFVGGFLSRTSTESRAVDIYDLATGRWSSARLAAPRAGAAVAVVGTLAIFAGGGLVAGTAGTADFYNASTGIWTTESLPVPVFGSGLRTTTAAVGTIAFFATEGGESAVVRFDSLTHRWSTMNLSSVVGSVEGTATIGSKALFEESNRLIDVYDSKTDQWTLGAFSAASDGYSLASTTLGDKAFFAGGAAVDIFTDLAPSPVLSGGLAGNFGGRDKVTVINTGDADLTGPHTIQLYATTDRTLNGAILVGSLNVVSPLAAGASSPFVVRSVIPKGAPAGAYHLLAAVRDAAGHVTPIAAEDAGLRVRGARAAAQTARPAARVQGTGNGGGALTRLGRMREMGI